MEDEERGLIVDYQVLNVGDDLQLMISHRKCVDLKERHKLAWDMFEEVTEWGAT